VAIINRRLEEIRETESAELRISEFKEEWLPREENPPVVKRAAEKEAAAEEKRAKGELEDDIEMKEIGENGKGTDEEMDEVDFKEILLDDEEARIKGVVWDEMYGEYLKEAEEKRRVHKKSGRKQLKRHGFGTVEEAFQSLDKRVSSKLNYAALEALFDPS